MGRLMGRLMGPPLPPQPDGDFALSRPRSPSHSSYEKQDLLLMNSRASTGAAMPQTLSLIGRNGRADPGPGALLTGVVITIGLFVAFLMANRAMLVKEYVLFGDYAADVLQTQRAAHDFILIGHYNTYRCNHPGPFFLYLRLLGQWQSFPSPWASSRSFWNSDAATGRWAGSGAA